MFRKKPQIKSLAPLRSSERRKVADRIINEYNVPVPEAAIQPAAAPPANTGGAGNDESASAQEPATTADAADKTAENNTQHTQPSLTSIRNSLLPESTQCGRFHTTIGADSDRLQGTVYVAPFGNTERVLWFKIDQGGDFDRNRIYPTVYTLWSHPNLVPLLHTTPYAIQKLRGYADLMSPGLANGPPFPERAKKGAVAAVADISRPSVPTFVGVCDVDVSSFGPVEGLKGRAVRGFNREGDELWAWTPVLGGGKGQPSPEYIEGWLPSEETPADLPTDAEEDEEKQEDDTSAETSAQENKSISPDQATATENIYEPTTEEIDKAFMDAFLYVLYKQRRDKGSLPGNGLSFPIQSSYLVSNLITPLLPIRSPEEAQYYNMKRTSWKTAKKFIKHLDKEELVKSKSRSGGEVVILDVDLDDSRVLEFAPYRIAKKSSSNKNNATGAAKQDEPKKSVADTATQASLNVITVYRPSGKLTPTIFPATGHSDRKGYFTTPEIGQHLEQYVASEGLIESSNPRIIHLNPFISNTIFSSGNQQDQLILRHHKVFRDELKKRVLNDPTLCSPYHAVIKPGETFEDAKLRAGTAPSINITIERRTGSKLMTKITGLEVFDISPPSLAEQLQKKCASSTTYGPTAVRGVQEVLVQGDHRQIVEKMLKEKGIKTPWMTVIDKSVKKKKT